MQDAKCRRERLIEVKSGGGRQAPDGRKPSIAHFAVKVASFDRSALTTRLRELSVEVLPSTDEPDVVRFRDNSSVVVELRVSV